MMATIQNLTIRNKLILLLAIPILGLLYFSISSTVDKTSRLQEMGRLASLVKFSVNLGELAHEMQKERGMSSGFLGSKGSNFATELPIQRQETDKKIAELTTALAAFDADPFGADLKKALNEVTTNLADLKNKRNAVSALSIPLSEAIGYYSKAIGSQLAIPDKTPNLSTDSRIGRLAIAYTNLLQAKERAGRERAILTNAFAADKFTPELLAKFLANDAAQEVYTNIFLNRAADDQKAFYQEKIKGTVVDEVARLKKLALDKSAEPSLGVDANVWMKAATGKINLLKQVEDKMTSDLLDAATSQRSSARNQVISYLLLSLLTLLITGGLAHFLISNILKQLGGEPDYASEMVHLIAAGDLSRSIVTESGDTTSLLHALQTMQKSLKHLVSEIQDVVNAAVKGDFSKNINLSDKSGFGKDIGAALNQLAQTTSVGLNDILRVANALADGDLSQRITQDYPGVFGQTSRGVNGTVDALTHIVSEVQTVVDAAVKGDFSKSIDITDKKGFDREVGVALNQLAETNNIALNDIQRVANALANGDLSQHITQHYPGIFGQASQSVNSTVDTLSHILSEVQTVVNTAVQGDFSKQVALTDKQGFAKTLGEGINLYGETTFAGLNDIQRVANALAEGDLTQTVTHQYPGAFGEVSSSVNRTVAYLKGLINQIKEAIDSMHVAAKEIAAGNMDLSQRTEEQAASLAETAFSLDNLTYTVKENAKNAKQANELAATSSKIARDGGVVVRESVQTMNAISESSKKIADIIGVIDSIAFQTNILALNAAVEAARAGEQGRGFAVVAGEVRLLAQRSASAAKEIAALITNSVSKVEQGTNQANRAGQTMEEIVASIQRVTDIMAEITASSHEQSTGIEQVNTAIANVDKNTQQNAALVEQASAAAESLEEQSQGLAKAVAVFKL